MICLNKQCSKLEGSVSCWLWFRLQSEHDKQKITGTHYCAEKKKKWEFNISYLVI